MVSMRQKLSVDRPRAESELDNMRPLLRRRLKGLLIDLDGVLRVGNKATNGASMSISRLSECGIDFRIVTNTTTETKNDIASSLTRLGFDEKLVDASKIFSAPSAAVSIANTHRWTTSLLTKDSIQSEFDDCRVVDSGDALLPGKGDEEFALIVGDAMEGFTRERLNHAFRSLMAAKHILGASNVRVLALGGGMYYREGDELSLDCMPFASMLARASEVPVVLAGKPDPDTFASAALDMGLELSDVGMVGDDYRVDIEGSLRASCAHAFLVQTGKYLDGDEGNISSEFSGRFSLKSNFYSAVESIISQAE